MEEEDHAELVASTSAILKRVSSRCQAKDGDFWPSAITRAAGIIPTSPTSSELSVPHMDILEELLRSAPLPAITEAATIVEEDQTVALFAETTPHSASTSPTQQQSALPAGPPVIYITWDYVFHHTLQTLVQTVHMVAASVDERSEDSTLRRAASENRQWLQEVALGGADTAREWCRGAIRWPSVVLRRKSALRYQIEWQGTTFPVRSTLGSQLLAPLEVKLSRNPNIFF